MISAALFAAEFIFRKHIDNPCHLFYNWYCFRNSSELLLIVFFELKSCPYERRTQENG